jgi:hypothetical protein
LYEIELPFVAGNTFRLFMLAKIFYDRVGNIHAYTFHHDGVRIAGGHERVRGEEFIVFREAHRHQLAFRQKMDLPAIGDWNTAAGIEC